MNTKICPYSFILSLRCLLYIIRKLMLKIKLNAYLSVECRYKIWPTGLVNFKNANGAILNDTKQIRIQFIQI